MTAAIDETVVTAPGVYGMPDRVYHADPVPGGSLSSSGAKLLLPPSCPAKYAYWRQHGSAPKTEFDLGHAAHRLLLGVGPELVAVEAKDWRTNAAKDARAAAYAAGQVPLLAHELALVEAMVTALRQHPLAAALFNPDLGEAEQSLFWTDPETGVWLRARLDFWRHRGPGRPLIVDYKTTDAADHASIERSVRRYGYYRQDPWYRDAITALDLADDPGFVFVFQERTAPYLVHVIELGPDERDAGRARNRRAIDVYAQCQTTGVWPGYADDVSLITLPPYALRTEES